MLLIKKEEIGCEERQAHSFTFYSEEKRISIGFAKIPIRIFLNNVWEMLYDNMHIWNHQPYCEFIKHVGSITKIGKYKIQRKRRKNQKTTDIKQFKKIFNGRQRVLFAAKNVIVVKYNGIYSIPISIFFFGVTKHVLHHPDIKFNDPRIKFVEYVQSIIQLKAA